MRAVATAHGVSLSTAYAYYQEARAQLQRALEREQGRQRALGVAVLPITLDQLIASEGEPEYEIGAEAMRRIWKELDRAMAADKAAGRLGDDGTEVERYMGVPSKTRRVAPLARLLRALRDPRVSHVLTGVVCAAGGAFVMYQIMQGSADRPHDSAVEARAREAAAASVAVLLGPAPVDAPAPERGEDAGAPELRANAGASIGARYGAPELHADTGAPELRPDAGPAASAAAPDDIAAEQTLFDKGSTLFQEHQYQSAIDVLQDLASKYPRGRYALYRERLLTLALIQAGRVAEARERIERLRRENPESPLLREFDKALSPKH